MVILLQQLITSFRGINIDDLMSTDILSYIVRNYIDVYDDSDTMNYLLYQNNHNINLYLIRQHY